MKKKLIIGVISVLLLLSVAFAGCTPKIDITKVDENVIDVFQKAIAESVKSETFYVKLREKTDTKMTEYKLNVEKDDKSIEGVNNKKVKFEVIHTKGIDAYTDTFIFGQSLPTSIKAKAAKASDYKAYVFSQYKKSETAPKHSKAAKEMDIIDFESFVTETGVAVQDYTMATVLEPLKELTKDDITFDKDTEKDNFKKGKVSNFAFKVVKEGHPYTGKGIIKVQVFEGKIMRIMTADEKFIVDTMYQGAKISIPSYDTYTESGIEIKLQSDRTDGMIAVYEKEEFSQEGNGMTLVNPKEVTFELVDSVVNYNNTFTEIKYIVYDADGNEVSSEHGFILTKNIVNESFDFASLIPIGGLILGALGLIVALLALLKLKKTNKLMSKRVDALSTTEDDLLNDVEQADNDSNEESNDTDTATDNVENVQESAENTDSEQTEQEENK